MKTTEPPIIVEQELTASPEKIWSALTELNEMKQWYFEVLTDFKAEVGFETQFDIHNEGRLFPHLWRVVEVIPNEKLVVNWTFGGYPGSSNVHFEIISKADKNTIRLTAEVLEDFPDDIPEFKRESGVGGWNYFIKERLKNYLDTKP